jgi:glycosyltransferase involved in cell wall biosynthesis
LRKGIQYLLAAARQLQRENVKFEVVGPVGISREAVASAPPNVSFHGRAGRGQAAEFYRHAHVFVLPTISDGFALTQLEAMAHGLPVIATPCCGEVVTDNLDGYVVPPRDAGSLARALQRYLTEPELLGRQSTAALGTARRFTFQRLEEDLSRLETDLSKA